MRSFALATILASASLSSVLAAPARLSDCRLEPRDLDIEERSVEISEVEKRSLEERGSNGVITTCRNEGQFALTFDDGPYNYGPEIEQVFADNDAQATFFVNGNNWECIYDQADDLIERYNAGHLIGSHTWGHDDISSLSADELNDQLEYVEVALKKILGIKPRFFRPPYGSYSDEALQVLRNRGYVVVNWSFDSGDSSGKSPSSTIANYKKIAQNYPKPQIALNHETYKGTVEKVIPSIVPMLVNKGYKLVTVAECLGVSPYQSTGKASRRDSSWTCSGKPAAGEA
ncbi:chitin deacetylase [Sporobolomyces salmoneus]|uniref:chitin deacetylase n=1 Tax=Sporobolomyces salmoneus TaxID=183962 RepID=UPI00317C5FBB